VAAAIPARAVLFRNVRREVMTVIRKTWVISDR